MTHPHQETAPIQPWERNDRLTRMAEWVEFYARCAIMPFSGTASSHVANSLKQDYARLKAGRATYWYNPTSHHSTGLP